MHPTFATITTTPELFRLGAYVFWSLLALYLVYDGLRQHGRRRLVSTLALSAGFMAVGVALIETFLTRDRLPESFAIPLRSWGLMVIIGMYVCFFVQRHFGRPTGLTSDEILSVWVYGGLAAAIGCRVLHVAVNWRDYAGEPIRALMLWDGGMAFIGGALAALIVTILYLRRRNKGLASLDALVLGVAVSHGVGRIGCYLAGCCYGRPTHSDFFGSSFPPGSIAQFALAQAGHIAQDGGTPLLHPTQLYSAAMCMIVALLLVRLHGATTTAPGMVTAAYLVLYPAGRFGVEMLRGDPERQFAWRWPVEEPLVLSTTQAVALVLIPLGVLAFWHLRRARGLATLMPAGSQAGPSSKARSSSDDPVDAPTSEPASL